MLLVVLLFLGPIFLLSATAVHRLFFHELSSVPGPPIAAVSNIWYAYQVRNGRLLRLAQTLHKQYGPAVRVGPNEVWFDSEEAYKVIYNSSHGFEKSDFYLATALFRPKTEWLRPFQLAFPDTLDLLSERDMKRYRLQRRLIGPAYHESNMQKFGKAVDAVLEKAIAELRKLDGAEVDLKEWMHIIAVECLGAVVLSWSPGFLKGHSDFGSSSSSYFNWRRKSVFGLFPALVVADLHWRWVAKAFSAVWNLGYENRADFKPFFPAVGNRVSTRIRKGLKAAATMGPGSKEKSKTHVQSRDLIADLLDLHRTKSEFTETYLRRLAVTNFGAGHETMCSALTAAMSMIGSHPDVFQAVANEVRSSAGLKNGSVTSARDATSTVPFTSASIKEAQRLHPAIGMSLPRKVPAGGPPIHLHGHLLPSGTIVGCSPPALHRNRDIFGADADVFHPSRWLDCDPLQGRIMERINLTWGGGSRTCPGRYLAELVVYKTLVALIRAFDVEATMPAEDRVQYYFLAMLTGVKARFHILGRVKDG